MLNQKKRTWGKYMFSYLALLSCNPTLTVTQALRPWHSHFTHVCTHVCLHCFSKSKGWAHPRVSNHCLPGKVRSRRFKQSWNPYCTFSLSLLGTDISDGTDAVICLFSWYWVITYRRPQNQKHRVEKVLPGRSMSTSQCGQWTCPTQTWQMHKLFTVTKTKTSLVWPLEPSSPYTRCYTRVLIHTVCFPSNRPTFYLIHSDGSCWQSWWRMKTLPLRSPV